MCAYVDVCFISLNLRLFWCLTVGEFVAFPSCVSVYLSIKEPVFVSALITICAFFPSLLHLLV